MAEIRELKASARPDAGKGAARAVRRLGQVPGVIYGGDKPPMSIAVSDKELRLRIFAGHFLTTIFDLEIDGTKHRVIPRDYQLDPVKDLPLHVDFMRLGEGATIRVSIPVHVRNAETAPGVKRGGAVNIVTHAIEVRCPADAIPDAIEVDLADLDINGSVHLSTVGLPPNVHPVTSGDLTLVTIVAPSGFQEEQRAGAPGAGDAGAAAPGGAGAGAGAAKS